MECQLFIEGQYQRPTSDEWFDVLNPATGELVGRTAMATAGDVDLAVSAAQRCFASWAGTGADERARIIHKAADLMALRIDEMAEILTREQGKPVPDSRKEILFGIEVLRYYAEEGRRIGGSLRPSVSPDVKNVVSYYPVGIAGAIVPWNYPVDLYCWKIGPALAAGCPIIVKPPHETPFAIDMVVQCFADAGLPAGVLANLPGLGIEAGVAMSDHPDISLISATASVAAGQDIMRRASGSLKRLSLELGGHAPFIVLPDADIEDAARAAMRRSYSNMGQICITVNRILVHQSVHSQFVDALQLMTKSIELGNGLDPDVAYGPVLNQAVIDRVQAHTDDAVAKGGRLLSGGKCEDRGGLRNGYFYRPTLIDDAPLDNLLADLYLYDLEVTNRYLHVPYLVWLTAL